MQETHSISAGLDYSGVGPEHALLQATGRVTYISARDDEALEALEELCATEGILTALETAHAYAAARQYAKENPGKRILIGNSGRGDKDMPTLTKYPARTRSMQAHERSGGDLGRERRGPAGARAVHDGGLPGAEDFIATLKAIAEVGDVVELGIPFSDPMADGMTIQRSSFEALQKGVSLKWIFDQLDAAHGEIDAPLVMMSYLNPLLAFGYDALAERALARACAASSSRTCRSRKSTKFGRLSKHKGLG